MARGWRWGRPAARAPHDPGPRVRPDSAFETEWAREPWARAVRGVFQELVAIPALRAFTTPTVEGAERLEGLRPPVVIAANHASHFDTGLAVSALPRKWRDRLAVGAAADYFFSSRLRGTAAALAIGAFPVDRVRASATSARTAVRLLEEGFSLMLFPEGGRSPDGWLGDVKPGAAFAAVKAGRPIVPMWLHGTEHVLPKGANRPRRAPVRIIVGDPLFPRAGEGPRDLNERLIAEMRRLSHEAISDWWTSLRASAETPHGPDAARWRRIWARGDGPERRTSTWT